MSKLKVGLVGVDGIINAYLQALANGTLGKATAAED